MRLKSINQQNARGLSSFRQWNLPYHGRERQEGSGEERGVIDDAARIGEEFFRIEKDISCGKLVEETVIEHENWQLSPSGRPVRRVR